MYVPMFMSLLERATNPVILTHVPHHVVNRADAIAQDEEARQEAFVLKRDWTGSKVT
eukprot:NODE_10123_length_345_cov_27.827703_g9213_i0.p3 GENE.NODE_10123_length_345_cov_27.827703_g9213_i0~~NODE_10123_length_345_cov_27.827703_g9213_i0.p3  ORF type:complete len:57 (+),score=3.34 NODE_10123_length_345_cov_27.827703_g9213_i0:158-328(+)